MKVVSPSRTISEGCRADATCWSPGRPWSPRLSFGQNPPQRRPVRRLRWRPGAPWTGRVMRRLGQHQVFNARTDRSRQLQSSESRLDVALRGSGRRDVESRRADVGLGIDTADGRGRAHRHHVAFAGGGDRRGDGTDQVATRPRDVEERHAVERRFRASRCRLLADGNDQRPDSDNVANSRMFGCGGDKKIRTSNQTT
jgi:hypothetical protein